MPPEGTRNPTLSAELAYFRDLGIHDLFVTPRVVPDLVAGSMADLPSLAGFVADCPRCKLSAGRTNIVFGHGNPDADLMFIGEAPGREEDEQGLPFVGAAGDVLTKIIDAMGMTRDQVYIVNTVKCRPPENRNPEPDEIAACRPFLDEQIRLVSPRAIVTLGTLATQGLLETREPISQLRGRWHVAKGARVMPTFHPAFLLRSPKYKRDVWEDMKKVRDFLATGET